MNYELCTMNYSIILAGGKGRRLWPVSRKDKPKQFLDFFGTGRTLLQQTYYRLAEIMPGEHILVVTNQQYASLVKEQLPELAAENIFVEPVNRNTAPATYLVLQAICEKNPQASVTITPADQMIIDEHLFALDVKYGAEFVRDNDTILTFGVKPTRPEPGYGYIQKGNEIEKNEKAMAYFGADIATPPLYNIKSFTEKPDRDFARMFIESGEFLWNTGVYMSRADFLCEHLRQILNDASSNYSSYPNKSIDMAILENIPSRAVMQCKFGWSDIGAWHGIYESLTENDGNNVLVNGRSFIIDENSSDNVVAIDSGHLAVISGLKGFIVAEHKGVLLICPKEDSSAKVRRYLAQAENDEELEGFV